MWRKLRRFLFCFVMMTESAVHISISYNTDLSEYVLALLSSVLTH